MIEIELIEISGFRSAVEALRLPFGLGCRSVTGFEMKCGDKFINTKTNTHFSEKDLLLMQTLVKRGDEHAKAIRGINVSLKISAPLYWWNEMVTYRVGCECLSSTSTMHTLGKGKLSIRDFALDERIYEMIDPIKEKKKNNPLYFETPEKLESKKFKIGDREYEIYNNGEIYSCEFETKETLPNGSIRSRKFERTKLKMGKTMNQQGYYQVRLGGKYNGKTYAIHRLIAEYFVDNPNNYNIVNHKDGNKGNCSPSNLEWCTSSQNCRHAIENGLKVQALHSKYLSYKNNLKFDQDIIDEWKCLREKGLTCKEIAERYNASKGTVWLLTDGKYIDLVRSENHEEFKLAKYYEDIIDILNDLSSSYEQDPSSETLIQMKGILPSSFIQTRILEISYQTLSRIYKQRNNHRLKEWHVFCDFIKTLPFAEQLILFENDK